MLGPNYIGERSHPREAVDDGWALGADEETVERAECELCRSEKPTSVEYGLRVCRSCEAELLP